MEAVLRIPDLTEEVEGVVRDVDDISLIWESSPYSNTARASDILLV
jgi:hypothetical protein